MFKEKNRYIHTKQKEQKLSLKTKTTFLFVLFNLMDSIHFHKYWDYFSKADRGNRRRNNLYKLTLASKDFLSWHNIPTSVTVRNCLVK